MTDAPAVIAIDGPAGSGKSTVARRLAERLGAAHLDTGSMYRAVALRVLESGVDPTDRAAVAELVAGLDIDVVPVAGRVAAVRLDREAVGERLRTPDVGSVSSTIAAYPEVRRRLVELQRRWAERHGGIIEGRDIGTVVCPETPHKFFLWARPEVRAGRRLAQMEAEGRSGDLRRVTEEMARRDARDAAREVSPLRADDTYTVIDSSDRTAEEVVEEIARRVEASMQD